MEKRVIVGGENLLEKAEEQVRLLNENNAELEKIKAREHELRQVSDQSNQINHQINQSNKQIKLI